MRILLVPIMAMLLSGCIEDSDERFDVGYSDGYAVGYNTECKIRTTLIEGDFDSEHYSRGYNSGLYDGAAACRRGE
jgi:hypothetical protein